MLVVVVSNCTNPINVPYAEGEDAEHAVMRTWLDLPHAWLDVENDVQQLFPGQRKGDVDRQRYLEHINAVDAGQPLAFRQP